MTFNNFQTYYIYIGFLWELLDFLHNYFKIFMCIDSSIVFVQYTAMFYVLINELKMDWLKIIDYNYQNMYNVNWGLDASSDLYALSKTYKIFSGSTFIKHSGVHWSLKFPANC